MKLKLVIGIHTKFFIKQTCSSQPNDKCEFTYPDMGEFMVLHTFKKDLRPGF